jgi:hypothetical protein
VLNFVAMRTNEPNDTASKTPAASRTRRPRNAATGYRTWQLGET